MKRKRKFEIHNVSLLFYLPAEQKLLDWMEKTRGTTSKNKFIKNLMEKERTGGTIEQRVAAIESKLKEQ